ncbi:MAG: enoyl-CoA hydratase/isomerase family protein [Ignavibacterium album]|uniref:enoyl-CoA hydratase/isomerase family protein n=1 Tax=Ignavibacterium album TaxID=591197 RepID=UPI0026F337A0|nr:enoyl-CoA hydratase/isomerase family protein [Ignavibacterium album]MBI5663376.1 enoyl-CoA hydratase/isomerase family protein [Ignavibacterium album]
MINYEIRNRTAIITLNRPEKRNALNSELVTLIKEKISDAEADDSVKSIILTGEGKAFCAGADLEYLNQIRNNSVIENEKDSQSLAEMYLKIYKSSKPTIAAVNGAAIAGGCGLASVCDFIIANPLESKFGYSEVKIGFVPAIVSIFLIKRIGEGKAKQLMLTGDIIDGKSAYEIGLVNYLSENVFDDALKLAEKLSSNSSESIMMTKQMIHLISTMNVDDAVNYCLRINVLSRSTKDFEEGINKFLNK